MTRRCLLSGALLLRSAAAAEPDSPELQLVHVRRVFVDQLGTGDAAGQIRDMIITALQATKLFVLTENPERADASLKGSAEDLVFTDTFQSQDGVTARVSVGSNGSGSTRNGGSSAAVSDEQSTRIAERKHEATAAVRLVSQDGDILWSTTKESLGAKFRGASADVADKIAKQLQADMEKARRSAAGAKDNPAAPR